MGSRRRPRITAESQQHTGLDPRWARIHEVVRAIPRGKVATYGQVAELAGLPGRSRLVGAVMRTCPPEMRLPWHRVVGRRSRSAAALAIGAPETDARQRQLLEQEGVRFTGPRRDLIALEQHGWLPVSHGL
jgi:methylated-DNA-protein-cysteine methyltransferase-like protein